jgi:hypothetical protein
LKPVWSSRRAVLPWRTSLSCDSFNRGLSISSNALFSKGSASIFSALCVNIAKAKKNNKIGFH